MSVVAKGSRPVRVVTVLMHEEKPRNSINTVPTNLSFEMFLKKTFNEFELVSTPEKIMIVKMDHFSTWIISPQNENQRCFEKPPRNYILLNQTISLQSWEKCVAR